MERRTLLKGALALGASAIAADAYAQASDAPIRLVFPFGVGSSGDTLARLLAEQIGERLGRTVVVENRSGAAGRIGIQAVKAARPDGTMLLLVPIAPMVVYPHVYRSLGYDPVADFTPLAHVASFDFGIAVGPQIPVQSLAELVAWAKANPDRANFGSPSPGTLPHFFGLRFAQAGGFTLQHVGYRGTQAAMVDLLGGHLPIVLTSTNELVEMSRAGRIRVLATSDAQRSPFLPQVPTFEEAGFPIRGTGWFGLYGPAGMEPALVARIGEAAATSIAKPDIAARLTAIGLRATGLSGRELAAAMRADAELWGPAVKASGFTADD